MSLTLGEKLRKTREERGISISEVAEQTRISPHYIKSIEVDDYKPLPGGIFNKGFIKSYARYIGMDENEALQDYAQIVNDAQAQNPEEFHAYRPEVLTDDRSAASMVPTIVFAVIILALMTGGILFLVNYLRNRSEPPAPAIANANVAEPANTTVSAPPATPAVTDSITVQLKAVGEPVWTNYAVDGSPKIQTLAADETVTIPVKDSFRISYSKAKADKLQITLNGKQVAPPVASPKGTVEFEINKENAGQIIESGQIPGGKVAAPERTATAAPKPVVKPATSPAVKPSPKIEQPERPRVIGTPRPNAQ
jgi:cytoskeletal protein RodZ